MERTQRTPLFSQVGLVASGLVAILLVGGLKSFIGALQELGFHNWLVLLFRINLGQIGFDSLKTLNPLDFAVLALVGLTFVGLWPLLARRRKVWAALAAALPFVGIVLLLVTHLVGRSAVMGAGLVVSVLMVRAPGFRTVAYLGLAANALLLVGDFATTGSSLMPVAVGIGVGYLLLLAWFAWIAATFWRQLRHT